jgi:hypothetical protein
MHPLKRSKKKTSDRKIREKKKNVIKEDDPIFYFQFFHVASKVTIDQEELTKSNYKTNRKEKNLGILLHVNKPLQPIN